MKRLLSVLGFGLLGFVAFVILAGILPLREPVPPAALRWVENHYREYPIGGGWQFLRAVDDAGRLRIDFRVHPAPRSPVALKIACPGEMEALWPIVRLRDTPVEVFGITADRSWSGLVECDRPPPRRRQPAPVAPAAPPPVSASEPERCTLQQHGACMVCSRGPDTVMFTPECPAGWLQRGSVAR